MMSTEYFNNISTKFHDFLSNTTTTTTLTSTLLTSNQQEQQRIVDMSTNSSSTSSRLYFYNRSEHVDIINRLSPLRYKLDEYVQPKLQIMGLIANLLCIIVMCQKQMIHRKSMLYLVFLASTDFLFIFKSEFPKYLIKFGITKKDLFKTSNISCFFYDFSSTTFHVYSIVLTLIVTIDRFNAIYNPLKSNSSFLNTKPKLIGFLSFLFSLVFSLPHGFLMVYNEIEKDCDARPFFRKQIFIGKNFTYYQVYFTFTEPVIMWFLPGLIILCLNSYVIFKILESQRSGPKFLGLYNSSWKSSTSNCTQQGLLTTNFSMNNVNNNNNSDFRVTKISGRVSASSMSNTNKLTCCLKCSKQASNDDDDDDVFTEGPSSHNNSIKYNNYNMDERRATSFTPNRPNQNEHRSTAKATSAKYLTTHQKLLKHSEQRKRFSRCQTNGNNSTGPTVAAHRPVATTLSVTNVSMSKIRSMKMKIGVNQISHYVTIIVLGFYFILSTIPYGVLLTFQNNLTLKLDYYLEPDEIFRDPLWLKFGQLRQLVACAKLFFNSNHCLNFFVYLLFNKTFRITFITLSCTLFSKCRCGGNNRHSTTNTTSPNEDSSLSRFLRVKRDKRNNNSNNFRVCS